MNSTESTDMDISSNSKLGANNVSDLFIQTLDLLYNTGHESSPRGFTIKESLFYTGILYNPRNRYILIPERKINTFLSVFETLWVLSGRNDIKPLQKIMKRAGDFSDDGETWRASYGERLLNWGNKGINQLDYCLGSLLKDLDSRQAVASLWDPDREGNVGRSVDFPCSNHLQFLVRGGKLHTALTIRSNDIFWGFSNINVMEFTTIQELMFNFLKINNRDVEGLGCYRHDARSMHLYLDGRVKMNIPTVLDKYENLRFRYSNSDSEESPYIPTLSSYYCFFRSLAEDLSRVIDFWDSGTLLESMALTSIAHFPELIQDYIWTIMAYLCENPKDNKFIKQIKDQNLVESLKLSWIPKDHLSPWK